MGLSVEGRAEPRCVVGSRDVQDFISFPAECALVSRYEQLPLRQGLCHWSKQMEHAYRGGDVWRYALGKK